MLNFTEEILSELTPARIELLKKTYLTKQVREFIEDEEFFKTIDVFFKSDLNISRASKNAFIHRNTLIYRINNLKKYTNFDVRKFEDAFIFKILMLIYSSRV